MATNTNTPSVALLFLLLNLLLLSFVTAWTPPPPNPSQSSCPRDALKLGVCADLLGSLLSITVGNPPVTPCCSLIAGLVDLEASVCLCTAIKANILGINLNVPLSLTLLLNVCSKTLPQGFVCE